MQFLVSDCDELRPKLDRTLLIEFEQAHPHKIIDYRKNYSRFGSDRKLLTTTAT